MNTGNSTLISDCMCAYLNKLLASSATPKPSASPAGASASPSHTRAGLIKLAPETTCSTSAHPRHCNMEWPSAFGNCRPRSMPTWPRTIRESKISFVRPSPRRDSRPASRKGPTMCSRRCHISPAPPAKNGRCTCCRRLGSPGCLAWRSSKAPTASASSASASPRQKLTSPTPADVWNSSGEGFTHSRSAAHG